MENLPDWLPLEQWNEFIKMRRKMKAPFTEYAQKLAIKTLDRLRVSGNAPVDVLEQSIMRGWSGLFEVKSTKLTTTHVYITEEMMK